MAAIKALQQWCKIQCEGYRDVDIINMSTSFRDGLAFCALIHKFRPDLINFDSLSKDNVYFNNNLAFRVAEDKLGIPALLDAEDMVALPVPDRLSILTYVSQYYNYFHGRSPIGGVGGIKRHAEDSKEVPSEKKNLPVVAKNHDIRTNTENCLPNGQMPKTRDSCSQSRNIQKSAPERHTEAPGPKCSQAPVMAHRARSVQPHKEAEKKSVLGESSNKTGTLNSECAVCGNHVHLVQRHLVDGKLYHRNCFKCSVCYGTLKSGAFKLRTDTDTLVCAIHQQSRNGFKPTVKPFKSSGYTLADLVPKFEPTLQQYTSVLSAPIKPVHKPVELTGAVQSWTASAQRTQAARKKFFQSSAPAADLQFCKNTQPSSQNTSLKIEESSSRMGDDKQLCAGNTNNNNALNSEPGAQSKFKLHYSSAEASCWKQKLYQGETAGRSVFEAAPPTAHISSSRVTTIESVDLSAISKKGSRPPSSTKANDVRNCEAPIDWRTRPDVAAKRQRLKSHDNAKDVLLTSSPALPAEFVSSSSCYTINTGLTNAVETHHEIFGLTYENSLSSDFEPSSPKQLCHWPATSYDSRNNFTRNRFHHETLSPTTSSCCITPRQISKELQDIENHLNDLENEGVELEWKLRVYEEEGHEDLLMDPLMVEWFKLIRKKQSYIRRESELMYISRTQDLEQQQPGVEGELRRLINKPEHLKTVDEKKMERELLNRLVKIVNDRNAIVEGLEEDRIREEEEDQQLNEMMQKLGLHKFKNKRKSSFSKLFRRKSKKASMGELGPDDQMVHLLVLHQEEAKADYQKAPHGPPNQALYLRIELN
ncbi:hypothetical protein DNTS_001770, partial [Danionella cerebrum]